jgi:antibiotic biosynthesis monooxygenase (ABM) superfamily enzyme
MTTLEDVGSRDGTGKYRSCMPELTGPFETGKLPKIAQGAVTVAIARTIDPTLREEFEEWAAAILEAVNAAPGSLGGTVLAPAEPGDPYHMVFRFKDALHLRQWERSETRQRFRDTGERFIVSEKVTVTAGTEEFFDALGDVPKKRSPLGRFFFDLAWVYPVAVLFTLVLAPYIGRLDVMSRVLISTCFIGATSKWATEPVRRWFRRRRMLPQGKVTR